MTGRYIAVLTSAHGEGATIADAVANVCTNECEFISVWQVGPTAWVDTDGQIKHGPDDYLPTLIHHE